MNPVRAKKIGAIYYKDIKSKLSPGDMVVNASTGEVIKFPADKKQFDKFCGKLYSGYFVKVKPTAELKKALATEKRLVELEAERDKLYDIQDKLRDKAIMMVTKGAKEVICLFIHAGAKEVLQPEKVIKAIGKDKLLSLGRRYTHHDSYSLWIALIETDGFNDREKYYALDGRNYTKKLNTTGYKPDDSFLKDTGLIVFHNGKKLKTPLDTDAIRNAERKKAEAKERREEAKKWKNIKTYDDKKEKPTKTKIFAYKGILGMISAPGCPGIIAAPGKGGSLGIVIEAKHCDITPEAKAMFGHARRESGSFAGIQLTGGDNPCIGWIGGYNLACKQIEIEIGRDCDKSTLDKMNLVEVPDMTFPKSFVEYVDKQTAKK